MPNMKWLQLSNKQLGQYAEYYAKMEFTSYGYDVYTSEVDDHGVDFMAINLQNDKTYKVQVKSLLRGSYTFIKKDKIKLDESHLVCLLHFVEGELPEVYVIPATAWENENAVFKNHDEYKKPEWGLNYSKKNMHLLDKYRAENYFEIRK